MNQFNICFDLNTYEVHNSWKIPMALRELLANAIDEQKLSAAPGQVIFEYNNGTVYIRDYGRGLNLEHFVQAQNKEKTNLENKTIGKFGYGLKDAIAYLFSRNMAIEIISSHLWLIPKLACKNGTNIQTIHMYGVYQRFLDRGTEIRITGICEEDFIQTKRYFLIYTPKILLSSTKFGDLYQKDPNEKSKIFINGLQVATDEHYQYHYDIIPTKKILDQMNRERNHLNKTIYSDRIVAIIKASCENFIVKEWLKNNIDSKKGEFSKAEVRELAQNAAIITEEGENQIFYQELTFDDLEEYEKQTCYFLDYINALSLFTEYPKTAIGENLHFGHKEIKSCFHKGKVIIDRSCLVSHNIFISVYLKELASYNGYNGDLSCALALKLIAMNK